MLGMRLKLDKASKVKRQAFEASHKAKEDMEAANNSTDAQRNSTANSMKEVSIDKGSEVMALRCFTKLCSCFA